MLWQHTGVEIIDTESQADVEIKQTRTCASRSLGCYVRSQSLSLLLGEDVCGEQDMVKV